MEIGIILKTNVFNARHIYYIPETVFHPKNLILFFAICSFLTIFIISAIKHSPNHTKKPKKSHSIKPVTIIKKPISSTESVVSRLYIIFS